MSKKQIIWSTIAVIAVSYLFLGFDIGEGKTVFTVKYNDNFVEYTCNNSKERETLILKGQHNCLFFDGLYFYDEAPSESTKQVSRVSLVKEEQRVFNGDITEDQFWVLIFLILVLWAILICPAPEYDEYDMYM